MLLIDFRELQKKKLQQKKSILYLAGRHCTLRARGGCINLLKPEVFRHHLRKPWHLYCSYLGCCGEISSLQQHDVHWFFARSHRCWGCQQFWLTHCLKKLCSNLKISLRNIVGFAGYNCPAMMGAVCGFPPLRKGIACVFVLRCLPLACLVCKCC